MAKIQVYVNDHVSEKINAIAVQRRAEGAKEKDVSYSSIASMLLELGFNQAEFNKLLLECVVKTQSTVAKILGIESLSPHVSGKPKFEYANMVEDIREKVSVEMERFFPKNDDE